MFSCMLPLYFIHIVRARTIIITNNSFPSPSLTIKKKKNVDPKSFINSKVQKITTKA